MYMYVIYIYVQYTVGWVKAGREIRVDIVLCVYREIYEWLGLDDIPSRFEFPRVPCHKVRQLKLNVSHVRRPGLIKPADVCV